VNFPGIAGTRGLFELLLGVLLWAAAFALVSPKPPQASRATSARPANTRAPQHVPLVASYTLSAKLDEERHRIAGSGTITFTNRSNAALPSLYFHLYLNAFKTDSSLFLRSPFARGRSGQGAREHGYIEVKRLAAAELGGTDLWPGRVPHSPSDAADETDIEVPLPVPLEPGASLTLDVAFDAQLPSLVERTGHAGSFHFAAQWFPKLAKLEPDGEFAHFPFHAQAEFYADFGRYDVTLDVPAGFSVGASGEKVSDVLRGARRELRYVAEPVHDFAWTAWDGYAEHRERIAGIDVTLLTPKGYDKSALQTLATLALGLPELERRFGAYPYRTLTVVHPPSEAEPAGGMEYPTLITTGGPWFLPYTGTRALEAVTLHELAHQWFYGLVATNEARHPFLDEGLASYGELRALGARFGDASLANVSGLELSAEALFRAGAALRAGEESPALPAQSFSSFRSLGLLVYLRSATTLETLARCFGRAKLDAALRSFAEKQRFAHPGPEALVAELRSELGELAARAFERAVLGRGRVNFLVRELHAERDPSLTGPTSYVNRVVAHRTGDVELPVEIRMSFGNGAVFRERWDGMGPTWTYESRGPAPLVRAVVDPEQRVLLDDNLLDNSASLAPRSLTRVEERLSYLAALTLGGIAP
jgi:hypothetical protein